MQSFPLVVDHRFSILDRVSAGGMGTVYRAEDRQTGALVALKTLRRPLADSARFAREVSLLATLDHPGIVRYVADGVLPGGAPYLVTEWVTGPTLLEKLRDTGLTAGESLEATRRAALALGAAHRVGVVHRDIKPANILFAAGDVSQVRLIDFSVARRVVDEQSLTRTGALIGTLGYMAPEQARGHRGIDARADVFGLGAVLYLCLTGRCPFPGESLFAVQAKILFEEPTPVTGWQPWLRPELAALVAAMLAKAPEARPPDGAAVARAVAGLPPQPDRERVRLYVEDDPTSAADPAPSASAGEAAWRMAPLDVVSVVLVGAPRHRGKRRRTDLYARPEPDLEAGLRKVVEPFAAEVAMLADGSAVATLIRTGSAQDEIARAVGCALALRVVVPGVPMALSIGNPAQGSRQLLGEVIDRGAHTLATTTLAAVFRKAEPAFWQGAIQLDVQTAQLLQPDFAVRSDGDSHYLCAAVASRGEP
jgi:hypothetical protein